MIRGYRAVNAQIRGSSTKLKVDVENNEVLDDAIFLDQTTSESEEDEEDADGDRRIDHLVFVVPGYGFRVVLEGNFMLNLVWL